MANLDDFFKKKDGKKTKGQKFSVSNLSLSQKQSEKNGKLKQEKPTSYNSVLTNENDLFSSQVSSYVLINILTKPTEPLNHCQHFYYVAHGASMLHFLVQ